MKGGQIIQTFKLKDEREAILRIPKAINWKGENIDDIKMTRILEYSECEEIL